jgi:hypothetical protein
MISRTELPALASKGQKLHAAGHLMAFFTPAEAAAEWQCVLAGMAAAHTASAEHCLKTLWKKLIA